jgi:hypothetical protein
MAGRFTNKITQINSLPQMATTLSGWEQNVIFKKISGKTINKGIVSYTYDSFNSKAVIFPLKLEELALKPDAERAKKWINIISYKNMSLKIGDLVTYNLLDYKIMTNKGFDAYGFGQYDAVEVYQ